MAWICLHCGGDVRIRNPKGFCDHLYYPDNCEGCLAELRRIARKRPAKPGYAPRTRYGRQAETKP